MFSTSVAVLVTGLMSAGSLTQPAWHTDYRAALAQASQLHKPVAVFISTGDVGSASVVNEGVIGTEAAGLLRQSFVALHVNTATESGSKLAGSFGMTRGLVISDRTGAVQVLRHEGTVSQLVLTDYLRRFSEPTLVAATTEQHSSTGTIVSAPVAQSVIVNPVVESSVIVNAAVPVQYAPAPVYAPVQYAPASVYTPAPIGFSPRAIIGGTPSCPNGRCPYAR